MIGRLLCALGLHRWMRFVSCLDGTEERGMCERTHCWVAPSKDGSGPRRLDGLAKLRRFGGAR